MKQLRYLLLPTLSSLFLFILPGCDSDQFQEAPYVQESAQAEPRWTIDINRVLDGVYRVYRPRCMDAVRPGHTIEFRNFRPEGPANVTSLSGPETLYSPNLSTAYNYISTSHPENNLCEINGTDGNCIQKPHWSFWRFTFELPGVYDWMDTNSGNPGTQVVDPYYGTITYIGIDPNTPFGTICVLRPDGTGCDNVCCNNDSDCIDGKRCFISETDAVGTCLTPSG